jgi:AcrR family transcriptional regulator
VTTTARQAPRPYLPAAKRREHLLDAAARLVRRGGWAALSMQGLAAAAGVSRQLVYEHFASADDLYLATLTHLFERTHASTAAVVASGSGVEDTIRAAFALFLDLPAEERRALRMLATEAEPGRRAMARARTRLRNRIAGIWVPYVRAQTGVTDAEAGAIAWMLTTAAWGLSDTIADGTLERRRGVELYVHLVAGTLSASRTRGKTR